MSQIILTPENVKATMLVLPPSEQLSQANLTINASGHEDGVKDIRIEAVNLSAKIPSFRIVGEPSPAIGYFPFQVTRSFGLNNVDVNKIEIITANGVQLYDVQQYSAGADLALPVSSGDTVTGIAPNSADYNTAFKNAVAQMRQKFPGNVSASVIDSGFVAAGTPVGIAYTYVTLQKK